MPKNCRILMIRHGEKPATGPTLDAAGQARAQAYVAYFQNYPPTSTAWQLSYLFAAADSAESARPRLTITPLANALNLSINDKHKDKDYAELATHILSDDKYDNKNLLICWHHGEVLDFASALGVSNLPSSANWPSKWPGSVFGWLLQLVYDANGNLDTSQTICINQCLMYDDNGKNPPLGE